MSTSSRIPQPQQPLIQLLDGVLAQSERRVQIAVTEINRMLFEHNGTELQQQLPHPERSTLSCVTNLHAVLQTLLAVFPAFASYPSQRDVSLPLHFAASIGNIQVASLLMSKYPQAASTPNANHKIPLHYAAREGRASMVDFLVQCQPHTAAIPTTKQKLALHFAAGDGHTGVVQTLLRAFPAGASMPSAKGKLALHFAARWGHLPIARDLLQVYPEGISTLDWEGSLPLHDAAREGQCDMAEYLIERFPLALATANLRGEIPLFPAVRSKNVDLVVLCVTAWPVGGKHVLQNIARDDNVQGMGWDMVELLLHGAVNHLTGGGSCCPRLLLLANNNNNNNSNSQQCQKGGRRLGQPVQARLLSSEQSIIAACPSPTPESVDGGRIKDSSDTLASASTRVTVAQQHSYPTDAAVFLTTVPAAAAAAAAMPMVMDIAVPRSKSPILEAEEMNRKKPSSGRKRPRLGSTDNDCSELAGNCGGGGGGTGGARKCAHAATATAVPCPREKTFIALHAALECGASSHVIRYILTERPHEVKLSDDLDRLPLHLAVAECRTEEQTDLVLDEILKPFPEAVLRRDADGRLPLHIAIAAQGNVRIIAALLTAYPTAGVEPCRTNDEWHDRMPIHMACHFDCCLSAVYLLLRADPSSIPLCS